MTSPQAEAIFANRHSVLISSRYPRCSYRFAIFVFIHEGAKMLDEYLLMRILPRRAVAGRNLHFVTDCPAGCPILLRKNYSIDLREKFHFCNRGAVLRERERCSFLR